jgi:hypothetical protein
MSEIDAGIVDKVAAAIVLATSDDAGELVPVSARDLARAAIAAYEEAKAEEASALLMTMDEANAACARVKRMAQEARRLCEERKKTSLGVNRGGNDC